MCLDYLYDKLDVHLLGSSELELLLLLSIIIFLLAEYFVDADYNTVPI